jgi:hypothetical protein
MKVPIKSGPTIQSPQFPIALVLLTLLVPSLLGLLAACGEETPLTLKSVPTATALPPSATPEAPGPTATPQLATPTSYPVTPTARPAKPSPTAATTPKAAKTPELHEFSPQGGKFRLLLPGQPKSDDSSIIANRDGGLNFQTYLTSQRQDGLIIWVSYCDYPDDYLKQNTPEQLLNAQHQALVKIEGVTFKSEKDLQLGQTYPGKEYQYGASGFGLFVQRYYLVNNRLYTMAAVGIYGVTPTYVYTIFDSFKLTN